MTLVTWNCYAILFLLFIIIDMCKEKLVIYSDHTVVIKVKEQGWLSIPAEFKWTLLWIKCPLECASLCDHPCFLTVYYCYLYWLYSYPCTFCFIFFITISIFGYWTTGRYRFKRKNNHKIDNPWQEKIIIITLMMAVEDNSGRIEVDDLSSMIICST